METRMIKDPGENSFESSEDFSKNIYSVFEKHSTKAPENGEYLFMAKLFQWS